MARAFHDPVPFWLAALGVAAYPLTAALLPAPRWMTATVLGTVAFVLLAGLGPEASALVGRFSAAHHLLWIGLSYLAGMALAVLTLMLVPRPTRAGSPAPAR